MSKYIGFIVAGVLVATLLSSCATTKQFISLSQSGMQKNYWLIGSWKQQDSKTIEEWKYVDKNTMKGRIYNAVKGDTLVVESYMLERKDKEILFTMNSLESSGIELKLKLIQETPTKLVFECEPEIYPKTVSFTLTSPGNKTTVFEGKQENGDLKKREFNFSKTEPTANK